MQSPRWESLTEALQCLEPLYTKHGGWAVAKEIVKEIRGEQVEFGNRTTVYPSHLLWMCFDNEYIEGTNACDTLFHATELIKDAYAALKRGEADEKVLPTL